MTGNPAHLFDFQKDHVVVAIEANFTDVLHMTGFLALAPEPVARAGKIHTPQGTDGFGQRFAVHPRNHENVSRGRILGNRRHQAVCIPFHGIEPRLAGRIDAHSRTSMPYCFM